MTGIDRNATIEDQKVRLASHNGRVIEDTGDSKFQLTLSWDAFVDLDIQLSTPKGLCWFMKRKIAGAHLDVDRVPGAGKAWDKLPVENIVCDQALPGEYTCKVVYFGIGPVPSMNKDVFFTVRSRVGANDTIFEGVLPKKKAEQQVCSFVVGADGKIEKFTKVASTAKPGAKAAAAKPAAKKPAAKAAKKPAAKATRKAAVAAPKKVAAKKPAAKKPAAKAAKKPAAKAAKKPAAKPAAKAAKKPAAKAAKKPAAKAAKKPAAKAARKAPAKAAGKKK